VDNPVDVDNGRAASERRASGRASAQPAGAPQPRRGGQVGGRPLVALGQIQFGPAVLPVDALAGIGMPQSDILRSARADAAAPPAGLAERMTLGFVLRGLARRRIPVTVHLRTGRTIPGTIDRALADHLDLAVHDPGQPRRADAVTAVRMIPFPALAWVRLESPLALV